MINSWVLYLIWAVIAAPIAYMLFASMILLYVYIFRTAKK